MDFHIRGHFTSFMKKEDVRDRYGSNALGTARKPSCYDPRSQQTTIRGGIRRPDAAESKNEE
jgi:hypothetical protein